MVGVQHGRWALILKIHHCMADGISGTDLFTALLDHEAETPTSAAGTWQPGPQPSGLHLAVDAMWRLLLIPYGELAWWAGHPPRRVGRSLGCATSSRERCRTRRRIPPTGPNSLVGHSDTHRRWTWANAGLDDMRTIRATFGGTVNDVIVTAVTGGLRVLLRSRGERPDGLVVRTLIPVSVRPEGDTERTTTECQRSSPISP